MRRTWTRGLFAAVAIAVVAIVLVRVTRQERGAAEPHAVTVAPAPTAAELREVASEAPDVASREPARVATAVEPLMAADGATPRAARGVLQCRVREADGSLAPLGSGALVVRTAGELRLLPVRGGEASTDGLVAGAALVGARTDVRGLVVLEAPPALERGGSVVVAFADGHRLHVYDARTRQELDGLVVHALVDPTAGGRSWLSFDDRELNLMPDAPTRVVATGASPLVLPDDVVGADVWIESPSYGVRRVPIDATAAETHATLRAIGVLEVSVPEWARRPEFEVDAPNGTFPPGYHVVVDPPAFAAWRIEPEGSSRRGDIVPGSYDAWLLPVALDGPRAPIARARVEVLAGQTTRIDFRPLASEERGAGTLKIVVLDGDPTVGAVVHAEALEARPRWRVPNVIDARKFVEVSEGRHELVLEDVRSGRWLVGDAMSRARAEVVVPAGGTAEAMLDLGAARTVEVEVVGAPFAFVSATDDLEPRLRGHTVEARDGRAVLHLVPGPVTVRAYESEDFAEASIDSAHTAKVRLEMPAEVERHEIRLELWHAGHRAVGLDWMWLTLHDAHGDPVPGARSFESSDRSVCEMQLAPGEYTVRLRDRSARTVAHFVADPTSPHVLVELDESAPLERLLAR